MYQISLSAQFCCFGVEIKMKLLFCCLRYYQEFAPLGTAGGIYHFRDQIQSGNPEAFFVLNSDVCGDFPLTDMLRYHRSNRHGDHHSHRELYTMLGTEVCQVNLACLPNPLLYWLLFGCDNNTKTTHSLVLGLVSQTNVRK